MIIFAHVGAGRHPCYLDKANATVLKQALSKAAEEGLLAALPAPKVVELTIAVLEDAVHTNAARGSSLNLEGEVQCDAIIAASDGSLGAVGAISCTPNPIRGAEAIRQFRLAPPSASGLLRPTILVGSGAESFLVSHGKKLNPHFALASDLSTKKTRKQWRRYTRQVQQSDEWPRSCEGRSKPGIMDTVGAVCIDGDGQLAAGASSGGNWLKQPGRLGPAAIPGAGISVGDNVAVATSGNGEHIVADSLALRLALSVAKQEHEEIDTWECLRKIEAGAILVHRTESSKVELSWAHTTPAMAIGYVAPQTMEKPVVEISRAPGRATFVCGGRVLSTVSN